MSEQGLPAVPEEPTVYLLRPAPLMRAFLIAGVLALVGAVLMVCTNALGWHVIWFILGLLIGLVGLALFGVAVFAMFWQRQVRAELTDSGYAFRTTKRSVEGRWDAVTKVSASDTGHRITFTTRDGHREDVIFPVGNEDRRLRAMVEDLTARLRTR